MNIIKADLARPIILGRQGEHGVTQVLFDLSWYVKTYGDGVAQLTVKRPGDPLEYMGVLTQDGTTAVWEIGPEWTEFAGQGYCYLHWHVDNNHAKTDTYKTMVYESRSACDAPEPQKGYLDRIVDAGLQAVRAEERAKSHADTVQATAKRFDETFSGVVQTAERNAVEANEQAQQAASDAGQSAANALKSEQDAEKAAELAKGYTSHPPIIGENGNWWEWDGEAYADTGKPSRGVVGPQGPQGPEGPPRRDAVLYTEQTLTDEQKAQARENIEAASAEDVGYLKTYVTPEMYGAKGDGVTDDTATLKTALNSGKPVLLSGKYLISNEIEAHAKYVHGIGAEIIASQDMGRCIKFVELEHIDNLIVNGNGHSIKFPIAIAMNENRSVTVENVEVFNVHVKNVHEGDPMLSAIIIDGTNYTAEVDNIYVHDISCIGNGTVADNYGSAVGLNISGYAKATAKNLKFENIHTVDEDGNIIFEDAAGIYVKSTDPNASAYISNVWGKNFGKRLIKSQCADVVVDSVVSFNECNDNLTVVGILDGNFGFPIKAVISNCIFTDTAAVPVINSAEQPSRAITCSGDVVVSNCQFNISNNYAISNDNSGTVRASNCVFNGNGAYCNYGNLIISDSIFCSSVFASPSFIAAHGKEKLIICDSVLNFVPGEGRYKGNPLPMYGGICRLLNCEINTHKQFTIAISSSLSTPTVLEVENTTVHLLSDLLEEEVGTPARYMDLFYIYEGAKGRFVNVTLNQADGVTTPIARFISNRGELYADGVHANAVGLVLGVVLHPGGVATVRDVMFENFYSDADATFSLIEPPYVSELPNISYLPNGAYCILVTDNKMYKMVNKAWEVVE